MTKLAEILTAGANALDISLSSGAFAAFDAYYHLLEDENRRQNLTALSGADEIARLHFLDSLALLRFAAFDGARVIDVGSGAGFPGLPLKIAMPSIDLTLLDATDKRVQFMENLCAELGIPAECLHSRAEELSHESEQRELYDIAVSRAVARLPELCELCLPLVKPGGVFLAMKSADSDEEIAESRNAIETLGAEFPPNCADYTLPGGDARRVVVIRKISPTPTQYPRRFAKIKRSPL
ncbi:MAG: 16S rRNA (guanine(527)-N(7))-methyltransferase RsmG [Oscillospiraceae bacterium]|nr:16S rRNA (guanine(527)-N(7))-methyltransferase RsmG [Oscillospiraceae bacterium]